MTYPSGNVKVVLLKEQGGNSTLHRDKIWHATLDLDNLII